MDQITTSQDIRDRIAPWFESWDLPPGVDYDDFVGEMAAAVWDDISEHQGWIPGGYADLSAITLDFEPLAGEYFRDCDLAREYNR